MLYSLVMNTTIYYNNTRMVELLNLLELFNFEKKSTPNIPHGKKILLEDIYHHNKMVIDNRATPSLLITYILI